MQTELMQIFREPDALQLWALERRHTGQTLAFVPTMGALHEGHASLIRHASELANHVIVSIFVNPKQFDQAEDLALYPRTQEADLELCRRLNVSAIFIPEARSIYPSDFQTKVLLEQLSSVLCGARRPGHFAGVTTVVLKLLNIVQANYALFGQKDYQQLRIIQQLASDLNLPVTIVPHPIVREADGLALSSRNLRLTPEQRAQALGLYGSLQKVQELFQGGQRYAALLLASARSIIDRHHGLKLDYLELSDAKTLHPVSEITTPCVYAVAAFAGPVRLIDNCLLQP